MQQIIIEKLQSIEKEHHIKILYALESGSRGWGFASQDSDYDVRFLYVHPTDWYLSIEERKDVIEVPINDLLDINGWDLKKALLHYKKSNPTLLEWLSSPMVYLENSSATERMRNLTPDYFSAVSTLYHYLHLAKKTFTQVLGPEPVKLKKYFYILRPLLACMWIEKYQTMPPMEFSQLMAAQQLDNVLVQEIHKLLARKTASREVDQEPKNPIIMDFFENQLNHFEQYIKTLRKTKDTDYQALNRLFRETLEEVWG